MELDQGQARQIILSAAGLARRGQWPSALDVVERLGFIQLDTNYVVERAHHHALWARVPGYEPRHLSELVADGDIFEYFTSDAGFLPISDFRYSLPVKAAFHKPGTRLMKEILDRIGREGPLRLADIEQDRVEASHGWWDWRPAKVAIEQLYLQGDLVVSRDDKFRKVYDVPTVEENMPSAEEFARYIIVRTLGALGIAGIREMNWRARRVKGHLVKPVLQQMVAAGEVLAVEVEGIKGPLYRLPAEPEKIMGDTFILSPFDVLNVFRHRLKQFFDLDYQVECFVPAPKRVYGYFSLPVLQGDRFIARMDAKADRKQQLLLVHNLHFEEGAADPAALAELLKEFVLFNNCRDIVFSRSNSGAYLSELKHFF